MSDSSTGNQSQSRHPNKIHGPLNSERVAIEVACASMFPTHHEKK